MEARGLELLAPARNADIAREAIVHGADAVYIGGPSHGARASASNSIADIRRIADFAHIFAAKVYVTLNTIIYDSELKQVERDIRSLYEAGVDALIVQDMGILEMDIPPIELHASTQCDIRTPEKAVFLARCGFSQLVLPREFSLDEIASTHKAVGDMAALEAFVHGALCVSYSGDCQASWCAMKRSANRGECAQMCRLPYSLTDSRGKVILENQYLLSLRDLNRLDHIGEMADAGISSFKIEGRLKDAAYVKTTVAAYRRAIDKVIAANPGKYRRTSAGVSEVRFDSDVNKVFNRGFTPYFIGGRPSRPVKMANILSPKWTGEKVGTVVKTEGNAIIVKAEKTINNGDGLGYFDADGRFRGFHLNRCETIPSRSGDASGVTVKLTPASAVAIPAKRALYRNKDVKFDALMATGTATRAIGLDATLSLVKNTLTLTLKSEINEASVSADIEIQKAKTPQTETRKRALSKFGGSNYRLMSLIDEVSSDIFIPLSTLSTLRQQAVSALRNTCLPRPVRRNEAIPPPICPVKHLTYHDNVANRLAEKFYRDHGVDTIERALEASGKKGDVVMTTRYCLRRELGACLKEDGAPKLPSPLRLATPEATYALEFDCARCLMRLRNYTVNQ